MRTSIVIFCMLLICYLTGCGPVATKPQSLYTLDAASYRVARVAPSGSTIVVLPMQANSQLATSQMAYVKYKHQFNYFAKNGWAAPPIQMIPPLIVKALQSSGHFHAVTGSPVAGTPDYYLATQLLELHQNFITRPSQVHLSINVALVSGSSGKILAAHRFTSVIPAPADNPAGGVFALNQALAQILAEIVRFAERV